MLELSILDVCSPISNLDYQSDHETKKNILWLIMNAGRETEREGGREISPSVTGTADAIELLH